MSRKLISLLALALATLLNLTVATDETRKEKSSGQDVVEATVDLISNSKVFPQDYNFLYRLAFVETHFGLAKDTFRNSETKGIWSLREEDYNLTKADPLKEIHAHIIKHFKINWRNTTYRQLNTPIYSGLAARLFLQTVSEDIPQTKVSQSHYWHKYYTQKPNKTGAYFRQEMEILKEKTPSCEAKLDLTTVLEGSGSFSKDEFEKTKALIANWLEAFSNHTDFVRKAFITVSSSRSKTIFNLTSDLRENEMRDKILAVKSLHGGKSSEHEAIESAIDIFEAAPERSGVPRVLTLVMNGLSGGRLFNIRLAEEANMTPFIIAISNSTKNQLQISLRFQDQVYNFNSFDAVAEFLDPMREKVCKVPQDLRNETTEDTLGKNQKRYYRYEVPQDGLTVTLKTTEGGTNGYYSYSYESPSSAIHDGVLSTSTFIPYPHQYSEMPLSEMEMPHVKVYLSVKGTGSTNHYEIQSVPGYVSSFPVIGIVFILIAIVIAIMAGGIIAMIIVMRRRAGEGEREMLIQKPAQVTRGG
ncbi:unnamed protein product [Allacma fusca]|uniref:VWFA domain-containing protein n=1 Tax=Allacma fusca TaxID=39272 RepID=A0A8J2LQ44_9HEXA|nr:unnamed protein product [Allacma fusca]